MPEKFFPSTSQEALALLFVQSQDLTGKTPEEVADMYKTAYDKICVRMKSHRSTK